MIDLTSHITVSMLTIEQHRSATELQFSTGWQMKDYQGRPLVGLTINGPTGDMRFLVDVDTLQRAANAIAALLLTPGNQ